MGLTQLFVQNLRIIRDAEIRPCGGLNIFYGDNAAGKTSLLEAIDILSRGRSFRSRQLDSLLTKGASRLLICAEICDSSGIVSRLGIEKSKNSTTLRFRGANVKAISILAAAHPVQVHSPDSHLLVSGSSSFRRAFLDWGLFHVKHSFHQTWQTFQRILQQRNAALKKSQPLSVISAWDSEYILYAQRVDELRKGYFAEFKTAALCCLLKFLPLEEVSLVYKSGWPDQSDLSSVLKQSFERDKLLGYTQHGPHRADIAIKLNSQVASDTASRGQQKLLVAALQLAQSVLFQQKTGKQCVFLVDDLGAELDKYHCHILLSEMAKSDMQVFVTALNPDSLDRSSWQETRLFHVEHGAIQEMLQ